MEEITLVKCAQGYILKQTSAASGWPSPPAAPGYESKPQIWAFSTIEEVGDFLNERYADGSITITQN